MLKRFYPDDYVDSAYEIPYEELYKKGYRGIVFDVDNTLVEHGAPVTDANTTFFVGDQLFTDVWGANRAGMMTILVKPIDKHEEIQIVLKRYLEKIVLHFYKKQERKRYGRN